MEEKKNNISEKREKEKYPQTPEEKKKIEEKIDEELEQTFPASDPPSYSQPGNDDIILRIAAENLITF